MGALSYALDITEGQLCFARTVEIFHADAAVRADRGFWRTLERPRTAFAARDVRGTDPPAPGVLSVTEPRTAPHRRIASRR